jgi:serine/threonine protein kinase
LPTARSENPAALARFYREARAAGALDHPNLVKAHDVGQDNGLHFLVMEYVDGSSLQQLVSRFGPLSIERSAHYVRQAAQGLHAAHAAGLVHRDIKPANILLDHHGVIRVLDLGLARFSCDNEDPLTLKFDNNNVLGTADYVAPEQALNSHEVDSRADIYSLGATFYFLLTGRPLFPEGQITHKLIWHQTRQPTPVRQLRPEVPGKLAAVVERMIDKQPGRRYQTAEEVIEALLPWTATPLPPPRAEEMPRLSPAARAAVVADTDSKLGDPRPGQRPRTMAEVATPTFAADQIDTASLPPSAEPVATVSQQLPAVVSVPVAPMRRRLIAFRNQRLISAILLLLLGVFTGTGIRFATHRSDRPPRRSGSESATPRETKGLPRDGQLPDQHPLRLSPSAEAFQPE